MPNDITLGKYNIDFPEDMTSSEIQKIKFAIFRTLEFHGCTVSKKEEPNDNLTKENHEQCNTTI